MAEIVVLPFPGEFALGGLFHAATSAEGRLSWFECLARTTLARDERAVIVAAFDAGRPVAALPLVRSGQVSRGLTAPYTTVFAPPLPDPAIARELGVRCREYVSAVLRIEGLDASDPGAAALLEGLSESGLVAAEYRGFANWYEPVDDFDAWWSARPSRLRATVRRKLAMAAKQDVTFSFLDREFDQAIAAYQEVYEHSWKHAEPHPDFIAGMVRTMGAEALVRMGVMQVRGRAVAAQIWLVDNRHATIFKLAHRDDAAELSPGTLLTHYMAQELIRRDDLIEIDFGRGDDGYKRDWLSRCRHRTGFIAADWSKAAGLAASFNEILPTRLGSLVRAFRRQSSVNRSHSAAAGGGVELSPLATRRMTREAGPHRGAGGEP